MLLNDRSCEFPIGCSPVARPGAVQPCDEASKRFHSIRVSDGVVEGDAEQIGIRSEESDPCHGAFPWIERCCQYFRKGMIQVTGPDQGKDRHSGIRTGRLKTGGLSPG